MVGYNCTNVKHTPFATTVNANALPVQEPEPVRAGNVTCGVQQRRSACRVSAEWNCGTSVPSQCQEATPKEFPQNVQSASKVVEGAVVVNPNCDGSDGGI
mmetsp:Transcript_117373/g.233944  ORF Transcript_117373/g.233944 Transcript_117373/m.233944 type:complete len:100 (-) Transcript_117373:202-501(-)